MSKKHTKTNRNKFNKTKKLSDIKKHKGGDRVYADYLEIAKNIQNQLKISKYVNFIEVYNIVLFCYEKIKSLLSYNIKFDTLNDENKKLIREINENQSIENISIEILFNLLEKYKNSKKSSLKNLYNNLSQSKTEEDKNTKLSEIAKFIEGYLNIDVEIKKKLDEVDTYFFLLRFLFVEDKRGIGSDHATNKRSENQTSHAEDCEYGNLLKKFFKENGYFEKEIGKDLKVGQFVEYKSDLFNLSLFFVEKFTSYKGDNNYVIKCFKKDTYGKLAEYNICYLNADFFDRTGGILWNGETPVVGKKKEGRPKTSLIKLSETTFYGVMENAPEKFQDRISHLKIKYSVNNYYVKRDLNKLFKTTTKNDVKNNIKQFESITEVYKLEDKYDFYVSINSFLVRVKNLLFDSEIYSLFINPLLKD